MAVMSSACGEGEPGDSSLLDDEFDLDDEDSDSKAPLQDSVIESSQEQGATMSDFM